MTRCDISQLLSAFHSHSRFVSNLEHYSLCFCSSSFCDKYEQRAAGDYCLPFHAKERWIASRAFGSSAMPPGLHRPRSFLLRVLGCSWCWNQLKLACWTPPHLPAPAPPLPQSALIILWMGSHLLGMPPSFWLQWRLTPFPRYFIALGRENVQKHGCRGDLASWIYGAFQ